MTETKDREIFSRIPMRTWRWLGVNESEWPEHAAENAKLDVLRAGIGESKEYVQVCREAGFQEVHVRVEDGAELHLVDVQLVPLDAPHAGRVHVHVGKEAKFSYTGIEAGAAESAAELLVELEGTDAKADVAALYFTDGTRSVDMNYMIRQAGRRTEADMQIRGALLGESRKTFRGTLDFIEGAKGSVGRENEEVVVLSPHVRNRSVPLMLSHEDDVDGHHAVSIGKMDEGKLFYLMSRGLDLAEAQRLVVEASFQPVLARVPDAALREEIEALIKERLESGR